MSGAKAIEDDKKKKPRRNKSEVEREILADKEEGEPSSRTFELIQKRLWSGEDHSWPGDPAGGGCTIGLWRLCIHFFGCVTASTPRLADDTSSPSPLEALGTPD